MNHVKELTPKEDTFNPKLFKVQLGHEWFCNIAWLVLIGFKVLHQDVAVDLQVGRNYSAGTPLKHLFGGQLLMAGYWVRE